MIQLGQTLKYVLGVALAAAPLMAQEMIMPERPELEGLLRWAGVESRSYLGVGVQEIGPDRAKILKLQEERGVEITRVEEESPASRAGLKVGDVVLDFNGQRVEGTEQFIRLVRETPAKRTVRMQVVRNGAAMNLTAVIDARKPMVVTAVPIEKWKMKAPEMEFVMPDIPRPSMSWRSSMLGLEAESLRDSQLAEFFGVKEGVLVRSVMKGSAAEKAGIRAGDVILKVGDQQVASPSDVTAAIRAARKESRTSLSAVVMREKRETPLTIALEAEPRAPAAAPKATRIMLPQMKL